MSSFEQGDKKLSYRAEVAEVVCLHLMGREENPDVLRSNIYKAVEFIGKSLQYW